MDMFHACTEGDARVSSLRGFVKHLKTKLQALWASKGVQLPLYKAFRTIE